MKLYLDPGHGGSDTGAVGNGLAEKNIALDIALRIRSILTTQFENVQVKMSRTGDSTKSLKQRTDEANTWGADFYLSIHCNAFNGSARGYEDYIHSGLSDSSATSKYRSIIHSEVTKLNQLPNRGKKKANFHVLRETVMPALLTENGFIDNAQDAALMKQSSWCQNVAQGHANGLAKVFNLKRKQQQEEPGVIYKVVAGAFKSRDNANERVVFLRSKGIESFVDIVTISGTVWYRVQAGAFSNLDNAKKHLEDVKKAGVHDAFIITEGSESIPKAGSSSGYSILGQTFLSPAHMNLFVKKVNPKALELGIYYLTFGEHYGIRGDIAFAQAMHETDYLRFTGVVRPEQNNFCGLGATGPDNPGASFKTPREGVLAHLQHLYAYASTKPLPDGFPPIDPRFDYVKRGSAPTWVSLNGKWAVPGSTYGQSILSLYEKMINSAQENLNSVLKEVKS